jgi:ACS family tartrate transporter-like MFS transporter
MTAGLGAHGHMQQHDQVFAKVARRLIPFMVALYTVAFLDRVNIGFAALTMNRDLNFSPEIFGWGAGIFFVGYFLFEVPSNVILTRVGARRWICRIMATWGVISAANAFVETPMAFYVLRFLLGLAEAGFAPGMIFYLSLWFPAALRARYAASYFIAIPMTNVIGAPVSGLLLDMEGLLGLHGWQWLFLIEALPALVLAVAVLLYLPDGPHDAKWLSESERRTIKAELERERTGAQAHSLWPALTDSRVLLLCAIYFFIVVGLYGITIWLPLLLQSMGYSNSATSLLVALPYALAAVSMIAWGRHSDLTGERVWHVALACMLSTLAFAAIAGIGSQAVVLVSLAMVAIGVCSTLAPFWAIPPTFLAGTAAAGGIALINAVGNLGGFAGPYAVGWALQATGSYAGGMAILSASMAVAAVLVVALGRFRRFVFAS